MIVHRHHLDRWPTGLPLVGILQLGGTFARGRRTDRDPDVSPETPMHYTRGRFSASTVSMTRHRREPMKPAILKPEPVAVSAPLALPGADVRSPRLQAGGRVDRSAASRTRDCARPGLFWPPSVRRDVRQDRGERERGAEAQ
jgi:hypothetical protein